MLLGVGHGDDEATADALARRICELRIFEDEEGRTNRSLLDVDGEALLVSQFTLYADTRRGRRPGFTDAATPALARVLWLRVAAAMEVVGVRTPAGRVRGVDGRGARERRPVHDLARHGGPGRGKRRLTLRAGHTNAGRDATGAGVTTRPRRAGSDLAGALGEGPTAASAGEHLLGRAVLAGERRDLEVRLVAAVGADAVHPRGLGVEPAHGRLAADGASAGHGLVGSFVGPEHECARRRTGASGVVS